MKPKDSVTLERGHLSLFRYPTRGIGTYLGRGAPRDKVQIHNPTFIVGLPLDLELIGSDLTISGCIARWQLG